MALFRNPFLPVALGWSGLIVWLNVPFAVPIATIVTFGAAILPGYYGGKTVQDRGEEKDKDKDRWGLFQSSYAAKKDEFTQAEKKLDPEITERVKELKTQRQERTNGRTGPLTILNAFRFMDKRAPEGTDRSEGTARSAHSTQSTTLI